MEFFFAAFAAGVLTVAAPCILPLLPIVLGSSLYADPLSQRSSKFSLRRPLVVISSLAVSILVFTMLLKATTVLIGVPVFVWSIITGGILVLFGMSLVLPHLWQAITVRVGIYQFSNKLLGSSQSQKGVLGDIVLGAALGPIFNSCSPTYALIVATVLPVSFLQGFAYLIAYVLGIACVLLAIAFGGQKVVKKLNFFANPNSKFRKGVGVVFVMTGLLIMFGVEKTIQTFVLEAGWYDFVLQLEQSMH